MRHPISTIITGSTQPKSSGLRSPAFLWQIGGHHHDAVKQVPAASRVCIDGGAGELAGRAVFSPGDFPVFFRDEAVVRSWRVIYVDRNLGHGVDDHAVESRRAANAGVVAVYCLSDTGRLISMIAQ